MDPTLHVRLIQHFERDAALLGSRDPPGVARLFVGSEQAKFEECGLSCQEGAWRESWRGVPQPIVGTPFGGFIAIQEIA